MVATGRFAPASVNTKPAAVKAAPHQGRGEVEQGEHALASSRFDRGHLFGVHEGEDVPDALFEDLVGELRVGQCA